MRQIITLLIILLSWAMGHAQIGTWKAYLAYHDVTQVEQGGHILYVLASNNLYAYNQNDHSIQTFDKNNALSDTEIAHIKWCAAAKKLVIVYTNYNIDLMSENGNVTNISAYYYKSMMEDKTVNSINTYAQYAYLATAFGIIQLNVAKEEISNTYNLGFNVNYTYVQDDRLYAASAQQGLFAANLNSNMLDPANWSRVGDYSPQTNNTDAELLSTIAELQPGGPMYNHFGYMKFQNGRLYTSGGGWTTGTQFYRPGTAQVLNDDEWTIYDAAKPLYNETFYDATAIAIDPSEPGHVFVGSCGTGIYEYQNGTFVSNYTYGNSTLHSAVVSTTGEENTSYVRADGLVFDKNNNLWMLNSQSATALACYNMSSKQWTSLNPPELFSGGQSLGILRGSICDSQGRIWFVNEHSGYPSLFCLYPQTEQLENYHRFSNQDGTNLAIYNMRCVAEDKDGNIWVGTNAGPLMIEKANIGNTSAGYYQVKVPRNDGTNYADYLLANVDISCIAIDGGGRKWFGTANNGVYLISEDNLKQIAHYTASNSGLLSDNVESMAIDSQTGEVFFGTSKGLCSLMSDATETATEMTKDNVYAYPNPVRPDYTGLITIVGLTYQAEVKITTVSGRLVAEGQSNGGTFTWDGCDASGRRVASGIYHVLTSTADGKKGTVCNIAIVN